MMDKIISIQKHLGDYGGSFWALKDTNDTAGSEMTLDALFSPDTTIWEVVESLRGGDWSPASYALMDDLRHVDFINDPEYTSFEVPIFIFQGEHDWQTPTSLVKPWFAKVEAPYKEYIAFEDSAHYVLPEEPGKYIHTLVSRVRPFAVESPVVVEKGDMK
jgi:pimeloyl-ACP methyl ester carboxylesterase